MLIVHSVRENVSGPAAELELFAQGLSRPALNEEEGTRSRKLRGLGQVRGR
jgi:hypothetical protein